MTKDVNTRDNNTLTHSPCHREPSQMAWRSSHNKVARSRVRALFTGLLRVARNDKGGVAAHDKGVLRRALQGCVVKVDCFAALAMTRVGWLRMTRVCCESGL